MSPREPHVGLCKQRGKTADTLVMNRAVETSVLGMRQREDEDRPDGRLQVHRHLYIYLSLVSMMLFMSELFKWGERLREQEGKQVGVIMLSRRGPNTSPVGTKEGIKLRITNGSSLVAPLHPKERTS